MKVIFSPESETDLEDIADEIAKDSPRRAISYVEEIRDACLRLVDYPRRYPVIARLGDEFRRFIHGRYSIFYVIETDHIRIMRIVHGARLAEIDQFLQG